MRKLLILSILLFSLFLIIKPVHAGIIFKPVFHTGLIGYWDFQEGAGNYAYDKSGYDNDGTWSGTGSHWIDGRIGKGGSFNGSDDWVDIVDDAILTVNTTDSVTYSAWIKLAASPAGYDNIMGDNLGPCFQFNGTQLNYYAGSEKLSGALSWTVGQWYHVAVVVNGATSVTWYRDGVYVNSVANSGQSNKNPDHFGIGGDESTEWFNGSIDEVRIYNRALSASEIQRLYKLSKPKVLAKTRTGLVGYWSFDEGTGTNVGDMSGNGNNGTLQNMEEADWVDGRTGKAIGPDGSPEYINMGDPAELQLGNTGAISLWLKFSSNNPPNGVISKNEGVNDRNGYMIWIGSESPGNVVLGEICDGSGNNWIKGSVSLNDNNWHHIGFTWDGNFLYLYVDGVSAATPVSQTLTPVSNVYDLHIGKIASVNGYYFNGIIDEVRIYNRALDASEIQALYKSGSAKVSNSQNHQLTNGLVGLWSFNGPDMDGNTAYDRSGQGNHGTLTGPPFRTIGKVGQALSFDGSSDYVTIADDPSLKITENITISFWAKADALASVKSLATKESDSVWSYSMWKHSTDKIYFTLSDDGTDKWATQSAYTATSLSTEWTHIVGIYDGSEIRIYLNGQLDNNGANNPKTYSSGIYPNDEPLRFGVGEGGSYYFNGKIDEVRIYNRALSAQEVQRLYNLGR